ncbi:MAG: malonate transporter subunit MadL [Opitutus sp.]|nr:malonate transporter subunit MadL [Opitutus sp.]
MVIYGVALLALCSLVGLVVGDALGVLIGVKANVGGVGFSMILLISLTTWMIRRGRFKPLSASGVLFWSGMYIPIVVAMAAQQNVLGAIKGGPLAFLAGTIGVVFSFALVPFIARIGRPRREDPK